MRSSHAVDTPNRARFGPRVNRVDAMSCSRKSPNPPSRAVNSTARLAADNGARPLQPSREGHTAGHLHFRKEMCDRYARECRQLQQPQQRDVPGTSAFRISASTMKMWKKDSLNYGRRTYALFDGGDKKKDAEPNRHGTAAVKTARVQPAAEPVGRHKKSCAKPAVASVVKDRTLQ